jgi:2-polyprenyl-3-methyl-5-hydroxy-6-metoxy-1,4-benzoquinol methylase
MTDNEELARVYSELAFEKYYPLIEKTNRRKMEYAISNINKLISYNNKIVDLGTGNGLFLRLLLKQGYTKVAGHEIPGINLSELENLGVKIYNDFDYNSIPSESYDIVTHLDVAEHVTDPKYLFAACYRILEKDGYVYFHTPVLSNLDRIMKFALQIPGFEKVAKHWLRGRVNILHQQIYTKKALKLLLYNSGFNNISIKIKNELSWPVNLYIRIHICKRLNLPEIISYLLTPLLHPLFKSNLFNANKAIVWARKTRQEQ